jgi:hypothetical protein
MELLQRSLFVRDVGENSPGGDDIGACVCNFHESVGGAFNKGALVQHASFCRLHSGALQKRRGYVGKYDAQRSPDAANCAKGNETVAGADVSKRHSWLKICPIKYPVCICFDFGAQLDFKGLIAAIA